ncbi:MAG: adenosylcobinamide amidohydrolase [Egibacteraceae bacterium]
MNVTVMHGVLAVRFTQSLRCLSSAVLGGGLGDIRTWLNVQVPPAYARTDPAAHLQQVADRRGDPTGTATDALCIACLPGPAPSSFAGPGTRVGAAIAMSVHEAVVAGALWDRRQAAAGAGR